MVAAVFAIPHALAVDIHVNSTAAFLNALSTATPGDTIIVAPGRYTDANATWYRGFNPTRSGNPNAPITIKSQVPYAAILVSASDGVVALGINNRQHIVIDGFKAEGMLKMHESDFITIQNCEVVYGGIEGDDVSLHWGIAVHSTQNSIVRNNLVHNLRDNLGNRSHNTAAIMVGFGSSNNLIENNDAEATNGAAFNGNNSIVFSAFGQKGGNTHNNTWRRNIARNAQTAFLGMGSTVLEPNGGLFSTNNTYYQNIVINVGEAFCLDHNSTSWNIYNNTVYNANIFAYSILEPTNSDFRIWNNIVAHARTGYDLDGARNANFSILITESDYNDFYSITNLGRWDWGQGNIASLSTWTTSTSFDIHSISADPLFVNAQQGDFKLQANSPAKRRGKDNVDMGAYPTGNEIIGVTRLPRPRAPTLTVQ